MTQSNIQIPSPSRSAKNWFFVGASIVGLAVFTNVEDPFNAPKAWLLYISAFWLLGWISFNIKKYMQDSAIKVAAILTSVYSLTLFAAFLATDNKFVGFFGDYARRTGFLAYFALMIFFLAGAMVVNERNIEGFDLVTLIPGYIIVGYGILQHLKHDPVKWNNPYNSILSTLGNPDFAAAVMAIFAVLAFALLVNPKKQIAMRVLAGILVVSAFITISWSQVRQGLLAGAIGIGVIVLVWVYQRQKIVGHFLAAAGLLGGLLATLGMLNMGPLTSFFYKVSVTYRGDYWRAGFRMFKSHPFFGVGLDRFGAYFTQYRDATQATRAGRGPGVHSNAAHDVPIQLAATGGIFVLLAFLAVTGFVVWRGIVGLRNTRGHDQMVFAGFFGAWVAYEAQSLISIDNLGIAIWGWALAGIVVALSRREAPTSTAGLNGKASKGRVAKGPVHLKASTNPAQPLVSYLLAVLMLAISLPLFFQDSSLKNSRQYQIPTDATQVASYQALARKALHYGYTDPHVTIAVAQELAQANALAEGTAMAEKVYKSDPLSTDARALLLNIYEQTHQYSKAIPIRQSLLTVDPYDYTSIVKLGEDLKAVGNVAAAKALIPKIDAIAPGSAESKQAHTDFGA